MTMTSGEMFLPSETRLLEVLLDAAQERLVLGRKLLAGRLLLEPRDLRP